jgi:hypothetical protein
MDRADPARLGKAKACTVRGLSRPANTDWLARCALSAGVPYACPRSPPTVTPRGSLRRCGRSDGTKQPQLKDGLVEDSHFRASDLEAPTLPNRLRLRPRPSQTEHPSSPSAPSSPSSTVRMHTVDLVWECGSERLALRTSDYPRMPAFLTSSEESGGLWIRGASPDMSELRMRRPPGWRAGGQPGSRAAGQVSGAARSTRDT